MTTSVVVGTYLDARPDDVWDHARTPHLLEFVAQPMIRFQPKEPSHWPDVWAEGAYLCSIRLFGWLPLGEQVIGISFPEPQGDARFIRDKGHSAAIRRWDHWLSIRPDGPGTWYEDRLELDAGWRTPVVARFAKAFYAHRQARWRQLALCGFRYEEAA